MNPLSRRGSDRPGLIQTILDTAGRCSIPLAGSRHQCADLHLPTRTRYSTFFFQAAAPRGEQWTVSGPELRREPVA